MTVLVAAALAAGCRSASAPPAWVDELGYRPGEITPIRVGRYGFPYLRAWINGAEAEMLLDTGNLSGVFLDPAVAERLALPVTGSTTVRDSDGRAIGTRRLFRIDELLVLGQRSRGVEALERPFDAAAGAIGPRFLRGRRYTLDYERGMLAVSEVPSPGGSVPQESVPLVPVEGLAGMIVVEGSVGGRPTHVQVDTGKSRTCIDPRLAEALGLPRTADGYRVGDIRIGDGHYSVASAKAVGFRGISGGLDPPIGLGIGSDILAEVVLTVDDRRGVATFTPR